MLVELHAATLVAFNSSSFERESIKIRDTARGVDHEVSMDASFASVLGPGAHGISLSVLLDRFYGMAGTNIDTCCLEAFHEPADKIAVEVREDPLAALEHRDLHPGTRCDVGELRSNVAAASAVQSGMRWHLRAGSGLYAYGHDQ